MNEVALPRPESRKPYGEALGYIVALALLAFCFAGAGFYFGGVIGVTLGTALTFAGLLAMFWRVPVGVSDSTARTARPETKRQLQRLRP